MRKLMILCGVLIPFAAVAPIYLRKPAVPPEQRILGKWYQEGFSGHVELEFFENNTAFRYHRKSESRERYTYHFVDEDTVRFALSPPDHYSRRNVWTAEIQWPGETGLILQRTGGDPAAYDRVTSAELYTIRMSRSPWIRWWYDLKL